MEDPENPGNNKSTSELSALMRSKCPRCRRGDVFANSMYGFSSQKMHTHCAHCQLKFEREPGYFYVSMFVSYALNVAEMLTVGVGTYLVTGNLENPWLYMIVIFATIFLLSPFNYRFSRLLLLYYLTPGLNYMPEFDREKKRS